MDIQTITAQIDNLATQHQVKLLWACESGSRAWGFASPDSDYDGRFLFLHPRDAYSSPWDPADEIRADLAGDLDFVGWDLRKALRLAYKSNPPLLEWLQSPIVYAQAPAFHAEFLALARSAFCAKECARVYLGTARSASENFLPDGRIKIKKLFYILRPLLAARWALHSSTLMPMTFAELCDPLEAEASLRPVLQAIQELEVCKSQAVEGELYEPAPLLRAFIDDLTLDCRERYVTLPECPAPPKEPFEQFYRHALEVWA